MPESILFITLHYSPEANFINQALAEGLVNKGFKVAVITAYPNYPGGKFFKGYFRFYPTLKNENGVSIIRVPHFPDHSKNMVLRLVSYMSFVLSSFIASLFVVPFFVPRRLIVYQTPFFAALATLPYKFFRIPAVYICVDLWPESLLAARTARKGFLIEFLYKYSRWINRFAKTLVVSTNGMRQRYINDGIDPAKVHFLPVWVDGIPGSLAAAQLNRRHPKRIVYAGNLGLAQGLDSFIFAFRTQEVISTGLELCFIGVGNEMESLRSLADGMGNVSFLGRHTPDAALEFMQNSRAVIAHLVPSPQFQMTLPSKLSSCLACGTPFLCGIDGEANRMFEGYSSVFTFESGNVDAIVNNIIAVSKLSENEIRDLGTKNQDIYRQFFDKTKLVEKYIQACTK
ncbi:MAG: glycosyltransferase family 4 protein [Pseudomonadota bacterium]